MMAPLFGGADVDVITGTETLSHVTQSETYTLANPDNPNQIVVTYNDSRTAGACYAGGSFSTDGGATFTRLTPSPFCSGHGTNFGDPVVSLQQTYRHVLRHFSRYGLRRTGHRRLEVH